MMKGILLAGGSGTRLYPLTKITSKQLLPVYDKPMVYYPLATLMSFGLRDILIISTPTDLPNIEALFGDGADLGIKLQYATQPEPKGIAQAFTVGADFIGNDSVCLILGDNIFYMNEQINFFRSKVLAAKNNKAIIFAYHVRDPKRFGVVEFDQDFNVLSIQEKPNKPKSSYASVGLYFYPNDVVQKTKQLRPSARGELEITDLNNLYLQENRIDVLPMHRGNAWLDAGTYDSLLEASSFVHIIEKRQGMKIACLEEIAFKNGFISASQLMELIEKLQQGDYREYLLKVYQEQYEFCAN